MGLAPESVKSLMIQRQAMGAGIDPTDVLDVPRIRREAVFRDWLFFLPFHYLFDFPCRVLFTLLPLVYLWTGLTHFYVNSTAELIAYQGPPILALFFLRWLDPARQDAAGFGGGIAVSFRLHFSPPLWRPDQALRHSVPGDAQGQGQPERGQRPGGAVGPGDSNCDHGGWDHRGLPVPLAVL